MTARMTAHGQQMIDAAMIITLARTIDVACRQCGEVVHVDFQDTLQSGDTLSFTLAHRFSDEHDIQIFFNGVDVTDSPTASAWPCERPSV